MIYSELVELNLSGNLLGNTGIKVLTDAFYQSKSRVTNLDLSRCKMTVSGLSALMDSLKFNQRL
jgi:hypothetical protein